MTQSENNATFVSLARSAPVQSGSPLSFPISHRDSIEHSRREWFPLQIHTVEEVSESGLGMASID